MTCKEIIKLLELKTDSDKAEKAKHFGVKATNILGVSNPDLRAIAKQIKSNHKLAFELWNTGIHEARMIATMIANPKEFTQKDLDKWVKDFDSWDITDGACYNLLRYTDFYDNVIFEYAKSEEEYIRRTPFALIAGLAIGRKDLNDKDFEKYLPLIEGYAFDKRNFVWKAVNWALRQIGKRSHYLHPMALELAKKLSKSDNLNHRRIGRDAFIELSNPKIISRIKKGLSN